MFLFIFLFFCSFGFYVLNKWAMPGSLFAAGFLDEVDEFQAALDAEFFKGVVDMGFYGSNGNKQFIFDFLVGFSFKHQVDHFPFPFGEIVFIADIL